MTKAQEADEKRKEKRRNRMREYRQRKKAMETESQTPKQALRQSNDTSGKGIGRVSDSNRKRHERLQEDENQYAARLAGQRKRVCMYRLNESAADTLVRLSEQKTRTASLRENESESKRTARLEVESFRSVSRRECETDEYRDNRLACQRIRSAANRNEKSQEEEQNRLAREKVRIADRRSFETGRNRQKRLCEQRSRVIAQRNSETDEERRVRLMAQNKRTAANRLAETPDQRENRLVSQRRRTADNRQHVDTNQRSPCCGLQLKETEMDKTVRLQKRSKCQKRSSDESSHADIQKIVPDFQTSLMQLEDASVLDFSKHECNAETSVLLFYLNQGLLPIQARNELLDNEEKKAMIEKFKKEQCALDDISSCGVCGMKDIDGTYMDLVDLKILCLNDDQLKEWQDEKSQPPLLLPMSEREEDWQCVELWRLRSIYESTDGNVYMLHPELVESSNGTFQSEMVCVCSDCKGSLDKAEVPERSVANGIDFGCYLRLGLTYPNIVEQATISRIRLYRKVVKIKQLYGSEQSHMTQKCLQGHFIAFGHDSPCQASSVVDPARISESIVFEFLAESNQEVDNLMKLSLNCSQFRTRAFVMYQWLTVLSHVHKDYLHMEVPEYSSLQDNEKLFTDYLMKTSMLHDVMSSKEKHIGSDVAGVRSEANDISVEEAEKLLDQRYLSASFITNGQSQTTAVGDLVECVDLAFNNDHISDQDLPPLKVVTGRSCEPQNEYSQSESILTGAFPFIFMYGVAHGRNTPPRKSDMQHILQQYNNVASSSKELLFYFFDQTQRHQNNRNMSSKIKGNPEAFKKYASMINSKEFQRELKLASKDVNSKAARSVLKKTIPVLHSVGQRSPGGGLSTCFFVKHVYGMAQYFGPGCCFFTIAPDDVNNPRSFRFSQRLISNSAYPATIPKHGKEKYIDELLNNGEVVSEGNIVFPVGYKERAKLAIGNSVATAREYNRLIENVLSVLIGVKQNHQVRKTGYYLQKRKGVFGHISGALGVHETQSRGALHMHIVLFGGLRSELLEEASVCERLCKEVTFVLDKMYAAKVAPKNHVKSLIRKHSEDRRLYYGNCALRAIQCCSEDISETFVCGNTANIHTHCFTCHKRPNGKYQCRMDYPQAVREKTLPLEILSADDDFNIFDYMEGPANITRADRSRLGPIKDVDRRVLLYELQRPEIPVDDILPVIELDNGASLSKQILSNLESAVDDPDDWIELLPVLSEKTELELKLLYQMVRENLRERNGFVVEYNRIITALTGCNTNAKFLGNTVQSNAALFYLASYLSKDKAELEQVISSMQKAYEFIHSDNVTSNAEDSGTEKRIVQHWLIRVLNDLDKFIQVSDTQAAAMLFGLRTEVTTHQFQLVGIYEALSMIRHTRKTVDRVLTLDEIVDKADSDDDVKQIETGSSGHEGDEEGDEMDQNGFWNDITNQYDFLSSRQKHNHTSTDNWGPARIYKVKDESDGKELSVQVSHCEHYLYRGKALRDMTRIEYASLINCELKKDTRLNKKAGRTSTPQIEYGYGFKLQASHAQNLRSKQTIPIHTGRLPQMPDFHSIPKQNDENFLSWKIKADNWAAYYLTAFRAETNDYDDQHRDLSLQYDYESFCSWLNQMENSTRPIDKFRIQSMYRTMFGLKTSNHAKVILKKFRSRAVVPWTTNVIREANEFWEVKNIQTSLEAADGFVNKFKDCEFSKRDMNHAKEILLYSRDLLSQLDNVFCPQDLDDSDRCIRDETTTDTLFGQYSYAVMSKIDKIVRKGERTIVVNTNDNSTKGVASNTYKERFDQARCEIDTSYWSRSQKKLLQRVVDLLETVYQEKCIPSTIKPSDVILCTGGPGTGKTTVNNKIKEYAQKLANIRVVKLAFMGVAAIQAQGQTLLKFLNTSSNRNDNGQSLFFDELNSMKLHLFKEKMGLNQNMKTVLIIIDEVSMITASHIALLDSRLRQATESPQPFGGMPLLLFGDFNQLPPVGGQSLCKSVMEKTEYDLDILRRNHNKTCQHEQKLELICDIRKSHSQRSHMTRNSAQKSGEYGLVGRARKGAELFLMSEWWPLKEQKRSIDSKHTDILQNLTKGRQITSAMLRDYKYLTSKDAQLPEWKFAPIVVATNRERIDLNESQMKRFAKENKTHVIRWPVTIDTWENAPRTERNRDLLKKHDSVFWQYFCKGAPAFITSIINIDMELANGTSVELYSISCSDSCQHEDIESMIQCTPYGSIISLKNPPFSVNVLMKQSQFFNQTPLNGRTLVQGKIVFPLTLHHEGLKDSRVYWVKPMANVEHGKFSKVCISNKFPYEVGFAMTVHKSQGRTMDKLILALSPRTNNSKITEMSYAGVFVALSRVKKGDDIRLLLPWGRDPCDLKRFLSTLEPDQDNLEFFEGYSRDHVCWDKEAAYLQRLANIKRIQKRHK